MLVPCSVMTPGLHPKIRMILFASLVTGGKADNADFVAMIIKLYNQTVTIQYLLLHLLFN